MEQIIQKQTSGRYSYSIRRLSGIVSQGSGVKHICLLCQGRKDAPLDGFLPTQLGAEFLSLMKKYVDSAKNAQAVYYIASSLSHYGKVDSLVTAGAMDDFVEYVYQLEQEEAQKYFAPVEQALGVKLTINFVREPEDEAKLLQSLQKDYHEILLCSFF